MTKGISYSRIREFFKDYMSEITTTPDKSENARKTVGLGAYAQILIHSDNTLS